MLDLWHFWFLVIDWFFFPVGCYRLEITFCSGLQLSFDKTNRVWRNRTKYTDVTLVHFIFQCVVIHSECKTREFAIIRSQRLRSMLLELDPSTQGESRTVSFYWFSWCHRPSTATVASLCNQLNKTGLRNKSRFPGSRRRKRFISWERYCAITSR